MDFPHLGSHCGVKDCNQLDFLPFECDKCYVKFCLDHREYHTHKCRNFDRGNDKKVHPCPICNTLIPIPSNSLLDECVARHLDLECTNKQIKSNVPKSFKCTIKSCSNSEFVKVLCDKCNLNFCLKHRFPTSHQCQSQSKSASPNTLFKFPPSNIPNNKNNNNNSGNNSTKPIDLTNKDLYLETSKSQKDQRDQLKDIRSRQNEAYKLQFCDIRILMTNGKILTHRFKRSDCLKDLQTYVNINRTDGDTAFALANENNIDKPYTITQLNNSLENIGITGDTSNLIMIELLEENPNENLRKSISNNSVFGFLNPFNYFGNNK